MRGNDTPAIAALIIALGAMVLAAQNAPVDGFAFTHVTVIDVERGVGHPDQTVVIRGNRIASVQHALPDNVLPRVRMIDAAGKYLIPGLWDMHAHGPFSAGVFVLHGTQGVTGIRHMGGPLKEAVAFRQAERPETGEYAMRIRVGALSGPSLDAFEQYSLFPGMNIIVTDPESGRRAVDALRDAHMDFVKIHTQMSASTWHAVVERARADGMPFAGHVPYAVSAAEAADAGQKSIEHLTGVPMACSSGEEDIRRTVAAIPPGPEATAPRVEHATSERVLATFSAQRCEALADRFSLRHTWQVPTFVAIDPDRCCKHASDDPRAKFLSAPIREWWESASSTPSSRADLAIQRRMFQMRLDIVGMFHRRGVPLLAGTDMGVPWVYPGFSLHDELTWFVRAGLTPAEALRTATLNPARYFDRTHDLGTVATGKLADLVLLDADPLRDIANTRTVSAVVLDGHLFDRATIRTLLEAVADKASGR